MSVEIIREIFQRLPENKEWHAHLLSISHSKRRGTSFNCRRIELESSDRMEILIRDIRTAHISGTKARLQKYVDVREYDGTCNGTTIYRISDGNPDVPIELDALLQGIANSDSEANPLEMKAQAYVLCGSLCIEGGDHSIKLISMNTPVATLRNRFFHEKGKFFDLPNKVLNLRTSMNVVIYDRTVYFLGMSGETLFNMERAYKVKCEEAVAEIETMKIISDSNIFRNIATTGQNPRRFTAFSKSRLELLGKRKNREMISQSFNIPLTEDKKQFETSTKESAENLVKVLCKKAMWDILEKVPVEVDSSKEWVGRGE